MKLIPEKRALEMLGELRNSFREAIERGYEHRASPCSACSTPGACCLDEHFVNVRVSRIEAAAIAEALTHENDELRERIFVRAEAAIERYDLEADSDGTRTYACPLFERGRGCVVHATAKPAACVMHACYENEADLPPDELLDRHESLIDDLAARTYGRREPWAAIPVAISRMAKTN